MERHLMPDGEQSTEQVATKLTREQQRAIDVAECGAKIDALMTEYGVAFVVVQKMHLGPNGGPVYSYDVNIASK